MSCPAVLCHNAHCELCISGVTNMVVFVVFLDCALEVSMLNGHVRILGSRNVCTKKRGWMQS